MVLFLEEFLSRLCMFGNRPVKSRAVGILKERQLEHKQITMKTDTQSGRLFFIAFGGIFK